MDQISRFVIWICSKFSREQLELIHTELSDILQGRKEFPVNPKDAFREKHPNYRDFSVDSTPPLTEPAKKKKKIQTTGRCWRPIRPSTDAHLRPSRPKMENLSRKPSNALFAMRLTRTCITTTGKRVHNCAVKSANQILTLTIVLKEHSKPNTIVHTANLLCIAGKPCYMSLFTNAPTITANTVLTLSTNSTPQKEFSKRLNLRNLSLTTRTVNIYSKPKKSLYPDHSNRSSTLERSTILKTSSG